MDIGHLLDAIPLEIRGFVIASVAVLACFVLFQGLRNIKRPVKAVSNRVSSKRDRAKAREAALADGFMVEDVERDLPDFSSKGSRMMKRGFCADYYYPERILSGANWTLYCRPGEIADDLPFGRVFRLAKGLPSGQLTRAIAEIANDLGTPGAFFEIEARDNFLHFFWDESDGRDGVARIKSYFDTLKSIP
ncbi:MAG: hypothetical protein PW788_06865 [Micavibrio sp.]|nr:hypothetical protein [Micavibrio sp.]